MVPGLSVTQGCFKSKLRILKQSVLIPYNFELRIKLPACLRNVFNG